MLVLTDGMLGRFLWIERDSHLWRPATIKPLSFPVTNVTQHAKRYLIGTPELNNKDGNEASTSRYGSIISK